MRILNDLKHNKYSAVYEFQKLKDRLHLTPEEENRIPFLPRNIYTPDSGQTKEDKENE